MWSYYDGRAWQDAPAESAERDSLMARLVYESVPRECMNMLEFRPSRDLWEVANRQWSENVRLRVRGLGPYWHKCTLDRVLCVRPLPVVYLSWWPVQCPAYLHALGNIWGTRWRTTRSASLRCSGCIRL